MVYPIFFTPYPRILIPQTHENLQSKPKSTNNHQIFLSTPCFIPKFFTTFASAFRDVAQPGRVHVWGACCRRFKSCHPDRKRFSKLKNNLLDRFPIFKPGQKRDKYWYIYIFAIYIFYFIYHFLPFCIVWDIIIQS